MALSTEQKIKCNAIIHSAASVAGMVGAGLSQLPMSDNVPLVAIQIGMAVSLGKVFGLELSESSGRGLVMTTLASMTGPVLARAVSQWTIGWIPWIGNTVNTTTAFAITEAIGWNLVNEFSSQYFQQAA